MGLPFRIVLYASDTNVAEAAAKAAFARISELNSKLSDYDTDSELVRLSQTAGKGISVRVSDDLWKVLNRAQRLATESDGSFDVTCGPVVSQWRRARREKKLPDPEKLEEFRQAVGYTKLKLNSREQTAELLAPYMRLDLGAIAKGFAVDEALKVLRSRGIERALVSGGGDMVADDAPPGERGWRVELPPLDASNAPPTEFVWLRHRALATSGDLFQHVEIDGVRYSHIVDPRTGIGLKDHSLVVVIAKDGITADSLSTAVSVLGPERGVALVEWHGACVRIVRKPAERIEVRESKCFTEFTR
ncbi:MAG TPA: FAD:protein FMN transferase [Candidatus Acidoferrum sp.]|nr:FAD:protein FMN transferase [Candidatus Acidoferrum sp.]